MDVTTIVRRLEANAGAFAALARGVTEDQARWRPAPGRWSIVEIVNHLVDEETDDFRTRLDLTLHRPGTPWPEIDPEGWVEERRYRERSLAMSIDRLGVLRADSVTWLDTLEGPDWERSHEHPTMGSVRAGDLLTSWLAHDYIHLRQLARLHRQLLVESLSGYSADYAGAW